ncbi:type VI secretion system protein VasJ [Modicisalibacter ilicicola DSM 19980]|uniref:Type VI secretion system protein VasJ n=1 Tax=Modicisalibacter ilicicola DSM 19980 TaxID=1121942 RepID=A0A1M5B3W3_9GAMM|nr:type VI secretion system protein TssA [Halomonas ilicicola]SHF37017.1 type VI secretion system protein VasJ [Halomonas ilicicola DSM 19980]
MTRITTQAQLAPLLAPLPASSSGDTEGAPEIGHRVDGEADYAWLDEEMMKIGSLRHGSVDWLQAESRAMRLLSEKGKDLKVLGHLLHCLQQDGDPLRFALSLQLLVGVLGSWWHAAWPFHSERARHRLFIQFTQRSARLAAALDFCGTPTEHRLCEEACLALIDAAQARELPTENLDELKRTLEGARQSEPASAQGTAATERGRDKSRHTGTSHDDPAPSRAPEGRLESSNERGNRQALLKMADFINEQSPGEPLGYRLRRHALWHAIHALPGTRDGERTELVPVSADRIANYRDALARNADSALWRRIEASLAVSPYWLEGHRLSAEVANALGHADCATAIREEVVRFVERLPGLEALTFNDGTPFIDDATREWLDRAPTGSGPRNYHGSGDPWQIGLAEAHDRLAEEGLQAALGVLDRGLAEARWPRDRAYWRLASAELLEAAGLDALARQHYQALQHALADIDLARWEPALVAHLDKSLKN